MGKAKQIWSSETGKTEGEFPRIYELKRQGYVDRAMRELGIRKEEELSEELQSLRREAVEKVEEPVEGRPHRGVETGETAKPETEWLKTPPSVEEEAKSEEAEEGEGAPVERHEIGGYVILQDEKGYRVSKGDEEVGSFVDGKVLEDENRALFDLDKGMRLEVSQVGIRKVMSPEKAGLYMLLCTEGDVNPKQIRVYGDSPSIIQRFAEEVKNVYDYDIHTYKYASRTGQTICRKKNVASDMISLGPFFDSRRWRVPFEYLTKDGAREQIISLGDGEGRAKFRKVYHVAERDVRFASTNFEALVEVQGLLYKYFNVDSYVTGPYLTRSKSKYLISEKSYELIGEGKFYDLLRSPEGEVIKAYKTPKYELIITGKENLRNFYLNCYPCFTIEEKRETLERALESYEHRSSKEVQDEILKALKEAPEPLYGTEIARRSNMASSQVYFNLYKLYEKGMTDYSIDKFHCKLWRLRQG